MKYSLCSLFFGWTEKKNPTLSPSLITETSRAYSGRVLQVIAPEEIVDPDVDEHSVMTYLSQFPKAKLKPGAPLRPKQLFPNKVKAYGPGM